jgi:multicomponent Na+:H+ antiporter subunit E
MYLFDERATHTLIFTPNGLGARVRFRHTAPKLKFGLRRRQSCGTGPEAWGVDLAHAFWMGATLFVTWLLLSGVFQPLFFFLGALSCVITVVIAMRMEVVDRESYPIDLSTKLPGYWLWLIKEIVLANIDVTKRILSPKLKINPTVFRVESSQPDELGKVIYANSITLTPGTVTIDIDDDELVIHALSETSKDDLETGEMDRRVTMLGGGA